jgi:hypothetical protein
VKGLRSGDSIVDGKQPQQAFTNCPQSSDRCPAWFGFNVRNASDFAKSSESSSTGGRQVVEIHVLQMEQRDAISVAQLALDLAETWNTFAIGRGPLRLVDAVGILGRLQQVTQFVAV